VRGRATEGGIYNLNRLLFFTHFKFDACMVSEDHILIYCGMSYSSCGLTNIL
jgi:hypothetical protein